MAQEKTGNKVKVQLYTDTHIWTGWVYCNHERLLDWLNGVFPSIRTKEEFLPISEVEMKSLLDGRVVTVQTAYINKTNILFVREIENGQTRGLGGKGEHKLLPFVSKSPVAVNLYMTSYTLTGQIHRAKGESIWDVLNSELRFLPLTNVEISSSGSESRVSFIGVNKRLAQICVL